MRTDSLASSISSAVPGNLFGWAPYVWSNVLFPGKAARDEAAPRRVWLLLIVLPGVLLYGRLAFPLFEPDEGRYAEIPREMLVRGEWIVPYLQSEPYFDKPPLLYWLVGISYRALGVHDWAARLVPALAVHLSILATWFFGTRALGRRAAFWGAAALALAPGFVSIGRLLIMDGLLSLWAALSIFMAFEAVRGNRLRWGWWILSAIACGLGILTKGPVALLLLAPPIWMYRRLSPIWLKRVLGWRAIVAFVVVTLAVALPWYVAICVRLPAFARYFLWEHNVVRFLAPFDHLRPIWFYVPVLLAGLLPATLLVIPFCRFLFSGDRAVAAKRSPELGFMLLAGGWCLLFFSLSGCKLPTYILPAFPFLALALGTYLAGSSWLKSRWPKAIGCAAFALLFVGHNILLPWYAGYRGPLARLSELRQYCQDGQTPILCFPRNCDSVAFYVGRDDLKSYRSKETSKVIQFLQEHPRSILLLSHRHSLEAIRYALPPELRVVQTEHFGLGDIPGIPSGLMGKVTWLMGETSLGLCDLAVIENKRQVNQ